LSKEQSVSLATYAGHFAKRGAFDYASVSTSLKKIFNGQLNNNVLCTYTQDSALNNKYLHFQPEKKVFLLK
jgi:hypothetical protein